MFQSTQCSVCSGAPLGVRKRTSSPGLKSWDPTSPLPVPQEGKSAIQWGAASTKSLTVTGTWRNGNVKSCSCLFPGGSCLAQENPNLKERGGAASPQYVQNKLHGEVVLLFCGTGKDLQQPRPFSPGMWQLSAEFRKCCFHWLWRIGMLTQAKTVLLFWGIALSLWKCITEELYSFSLCLMLSPCHGAWGWNKAVKSRVCC